MRMACSLLSLLLGLLVAACGGKGPATLVVSGSGFNALEGKTVRLALVDVAGRRIAQTAAPITVSGGAIQFSLQVTSGTDYRVDLYADADSDGQCQWGFDEVHAIDVRGIGEHATKTVTIDPGVTDSRGCLSFGASSLHVTASNIQTTKTIWAAALVRCPAGDRTCEIGAGETAGFLNGTLVNGKIDLVFDGGIVPGYFYRVNVFVNDLVGLEVTCDSAPVKLSKLSVMLGGSPTDGLTGETIDMAIDPEINQTDATICASFSPG